jgi:hypothetical protein
MRKEATMSIPVELNSLAEVMMQYPFAYLLTTRAGAAPHAVAVTAVMDGGELVVAATGQRTRANALQAPAVSLVWPPSSPQAYSLIIDGLASVTGESIRIAPSRAVLHRPAPSPSAHSCRRLRVGLPAVDPGRRGGQVMTRPTTGVVPILTVDNRHRSHDPGLPCARYRVG